MAKKTPTDKTPVDSPLGENTVLHLTIETTDHQKAYSAALQKIATHVKHPGFRQGKTPLKIAEETVGREEVVKEALQSLLPTRYTKLIEESKITPIVEPSYQIKTSPADAAWEIEIITAVTPEVILGDYQKLIKEGAIEGKKEMTGETEHEHGEDHEKQHLMGVIFRKLIASHGPKIPPRLLEDQVQREFSRLLSNLKQHRLELNDYLKASGKTIEQLEEEYTANTLAGLQLEFLFNAIALDQKIEDEDPVKVRQKTVDRILELSK
ncbi:MAG TPA: trigger factor [Patescibacteria group bacterium]|nr:trigger factor [Patescibacteria group bacterium]